MSQVGQLLLSALLVQLGAALVLPTAQTDCSHIEDVFRFKNLTSADYPLTPANDTGRGMCGGGSAACCTPEMEGVLKKTVAEDLHSLLYHSFHSLHGMLASTEAAVKDAVRQTSKTSENMTLSIFADIYKGMWNDVRGPVDELYRNLASYLSRERKIPADIPPPIPSEDSTELEGYVREFFRRLFPPVYQETVRSLSKNRSAVSDEYAACLSTSMEKIMPFGSYPDTLAKRVAKSFETTKVILESLSLGMEVLDVMSGVHDNSESCREALLRLYYCPKCLGLPSRVKPCNGYCLNVMRGCLTQQRTTELDLPWSNFLFEVQSVVAQVVDTSEKIPSVDEVLYSFSSTISDAIMLAAINGPQLEKQVKRACGPAEVRVRTTPEPPPETLTVRKRPVGSKGPVTSQLKQFGRAVETSKARGFFANLAEALCSDDSFAETRDTADCWNGHRVGEYTKALVRPGLDAQKYNPELQWKETAADPAIRELSDKLRHMRQVVMSHSHQNSLALVSFSQTMGSGSGESDRWDDTEDNTDQEDGSGSGDGGPDVKGETDESTHGTDRGREEIVRKVDTAPGSGFGLRASLPIIVLALSTRWIM